jgi:methionine-rich copper-binding protein CopC
VSCPARYHPRLVVTRFAACLLAAVLALFVAAPGAVAQAELTGSDPADGASVAGAPRSVTLTFSSPVSADLAVIFVTGADGRAWDAGAITASGDSLTMPVTPSGPAGRCTIEYNIASEDHPASGALHFTLTAPAPSAAPTSDSASGPAAGDDPVADQAERPRGSRLWIWVLVGAVIVGVAVGVVFAGTWRRRD